jgi:hypothetical protein
MLRNRMILAATILALPTYLRARSGPEWCTSERCAERSTAEWCAEWCTAERRAERCTAEQRGRQCRESVNSSPQSRLARNRNWKRANRDHSRWKGKSMVCAWPAMPRRKHPNSRGNEFVEAANPCSRPPVPA